MRFEEALPLIREGQRLMRKGWHAQHQWVSHSQARAGLAEPVWMLLLPFLSFRTVGGDYVPWVASQEDLLADDWEVYDGPADTERSVRGAETSGTAPDPPKAAKPLESGSRGRKRARGA